MRSLSLAQGGTFETKNLAAPVRLKLPGAGRLGFYIDYSELDDVGTHTFYVTRTHGSSGVVGCTWTAYDSINGSELGKGTLRWENESLDIKAFSVDVLEKPVGDSRIFVLLSDATGGAELHHGDNTVAYGIIEDGTLTDENSLFIDAESKSNGDGSYEKPFNNWYSARDAVTLATRTIFIKGMMIPDGTDKTGGSDTSCFLLTANMGGRTSETQRLVIRNWPGFSGGIDGGGQNHCTGFFIDGRLSTNNLEYITFRNLNATRLDNSLRNHFSHPCYFLRTKGDSGSVVGKITAEKINIDGIVSGANAAIASWFSENCSNLKMWRWNVANTSHVGKEYELNTFECYRTDNVSIQRCTIERTAGGIYQKEGFVDEAKVGMSVRFNHLKGAYVRFSTQGNRKAQDFSIVQSNIFDDAHRRHISGPLRFDMNSTSSHTSSHVISNNIFYNYDFSTYADITFGNYGYHGVVIYNNIHYKSKRPLTFNKGVSPAAYIDFNHYEYSAGTPPTFRYLSRDDVSLKFLKDKTSFFENSSVGNLSIDKNTWRVTNSSRIFNSGLNNTNKGIYLVGNERIGSGNLSVSSPPQKITLPEVTILKKSS